MNSTKGRTCCGKGDTDWDEFLKLRGCCTGVHSSEKPERPAFSVASNTPDLVNDSAPQRLFPSTTEVVVEVEPDQEKIEFVSAAGLFQCKHMGCMREYDPRENVDGSCQYHPGMASFKDTRKFWSCCNASTYDWDDFLRLPKCAAGFHEPRLVNR
jgi:disease resistance protein